MELGKTIRQHRLARTMTQEALGVQLGVTAQAVSKWESGAAMPDIALLPQLSVALGLTLDQLFSVDDSRRMDRIENLLEAVRFLPDREFQDAERFLREKQSDEALRPRATLLLAQLYVQRGNEYHDLARPLARQALLLNPDEKPAHNAIFDAERAPYSDWNTTNHWELIAFYRDFLAAHPENPRTYLWLLDLLIDDGRTAEAREVLDAMDRVEHTYRTDLYAGLIAKADCDLPTALSHWQKMVDDYPDFWLAWASRGDCLARLCRYDEAVACYQKSLDLQPPPRYMDMPEAMSQIAEIRGDYAEAIHQRQICIDLCRTDWNITEGEWVDQHQRQIARLREKL